MTPVEQFFIRGLGQTGWYGDPEIEQLVQEWLLAPDPAAAQAAADKVQTRVFDQAPYLPSGQFRFRTARRKNIQGQIEAGGAFFWNIRRVQGAHSVERDWPLRPNVFADSGDRDRDHVRGSIGLLL